MDEQVLIEGTKVVKVVGEVIAIDSHGKARVLAVGDVLKANELIVTAKNSSVELTEQVEVVDIPETALLVVMNKVP